MYKASEFFTDLQDNDYAYNIGDVYPRKGYTPSDVRIEELATDKNVRHRPVIVAVSETIAEPVKEAPALSENETVEQEEKPKKRRKREE